MSMKRSRGGFTLMELMVATAILALMVLMLAQMADLSSKSMNDGLRRAGTFARARAALDLYATDVAQGVFRADMGAFRDRDGRPASAFWVRRTAIGGDRPLSLVSYQYDAGEAALRRAGLPVRWSEAVSAGFGFPDSIPRHSTLGPADYQEIAHAVLAVQFLFIDSEGARRSEYARVYTTRPNGTPYLPGEARPGCRAVSIALAALDEQAFDLLVRTGGLASLQGALGRQAEGAELESYRAYWTRQVLEHPSTLDYPAPVRLGLRLFERTMPLPPG